MLNEYHKVDRPAVITRQPEGVAPPANITEPLVDSQGEVLLPRIVGRLREEMALAEEQARRPRSVVDAGERYPAIDHAKLYAFEDYGRSLQNEALREGLAAGWQWLKRIVARAPRREDAQPVVSERTRSVVDAGERYPAIDHAKLYAFEDYGRSLHNEATFDALAAGWRWLAEGVARTFGDSPAPVQMQAGPEYWRTRAIYFGAF